MAMILIEADDFIIATAPDFRDELKKLMGNRFDSCNWEAENAECAARSITIPPSRDRTEVS